MRIGIDLRMAGLEYGIGRYSLELVRKIIELDRDNEYFLFVRDEKSFSKTNFEFRLNVNLVKADYKHYSFSEQFSFNRLLNKYNLDLVHFLNFNVPFMYNKPFVVTIHDIIHHRLPGTKKSHFLHRLAYRAVMHHAVFASRRIITVSEFSKKEILDVFKVPAKKIQVIYEAATTVPITDSDVSLVKQNFDISKPYLIFVGVMERKKNLLNLVKAFDILKDKFNLNVQLVLAGKADPHYPEIQEQVKEIKYRKDLILTGVVSEKEKYALYKGAEAFVSASLFEGFGLPGVEAMSLGIPLVVSNTEVFNEVYDNGAIYFDPHDPEDMAQKINFLLSDEKYRALIANNAYTRAQYFSWDLAARRTLEVYKT